MGTYKNRDTDSKRFHFRNILIVELNTVGNDFIIKKAKKEKRYWLSVAEDTGEQEMISN